MKCVFMAHGWAGSPEGGWLEWLKIELEKRGFEVTASQMPNVETPKIGEWVPFLSGLVRGAASGRLFCRAQHRLPNDNPLSRIHRSQKSGRCRFCCRLVHAQGTGRSR